MCGWATGWRRTGECIFFSAFTRSLKTRRTRQVLGDSSFHCQRIYFLFGLSVCCWRCRSPAQADQGSPAACKHGERSKINKPKVSRPKANQRIFFSFSFFQTLKRLVSKVSISNKKNRQFQLLNTGREEQLLFSEREKNTPPTTHNFQPHFCQQHSKQFL